MARTFKFRGNQEDFGAFDIVFAGILTTKGGAAAEVFNVRGVEAADIALVMRHTTTTRTADLAVCGKNRVTVTFSADPSTTHKINLLVIRKRNKVGAKRRKY